jgi:PAS domain S-box-containing protein
MLSRSPLWWRQPPVILRYAVALLSTITSLIILWWMNTVGEAAAHVSLFLCAVMFSAWFGGFKPGLLALGISMLAFNYYFLSPTHSLGVQLTQLPRLVLFALSGLFVASLTGAQRSAAESLTQARDDLQKRSRELERINTALQAENLERKRAEYLTGRVFESLPDGVAIIGRDYRYQQVNPVYEQQWRMSAERIVGRHVADVVGMDVFEQIAKPHLDRCFEGEESGYAGWFSNALGRRYVAGTCSPLRPHSEPVESALVIVRDLSEHMLASEALREAQAELAHVTRVTTLGEVTASFAHELNQPLAAILNNANACLGLLPSGRADLDEVRDALADIVTDAERASAIIERVRGLAKRSSPERVPLRLVDVVDDVVALAAAESVARRVAIRTDIPADLPVVLGDRVQLQQVVLNLVVNGMDAMSTVDEPERKLEIRGRPDTQDGSPAARISVQDRGIGLHGGQADRLFEAFYTTKPHGMGLGLAISRSIIEAHGGRLWAESNRGPGATFSFRLPAAAASAAT